jgi:hypothetical protein
MSSWASPELQSDDGPPPEWVHAYVAALIDNHASIIVSIARASNRSLGYRPKQELRYKSDQQPVLELLKQYCAAYDVTPRVTEQSGSTSQRFTVELSARSDIVAFLTPLRPYLQVQERAVTLLLETLIPGLNAGAHSEPETFLIWTQYLDAFREAAGRANRHKYDHEYFREEFDAAVPADPDAWVDTTINTSQESPSAVPQGVDPPKRGTPGSNVLSEQHPEWLAAYVAGLVDAHFDFVIGIGKQETRAVGYKITHRLQYNAEGQTVCELLQAYLHAIGIDPRIRDRTDTEYDHYEVTIAKRNDIVTLLEALRPHLVARAEAAQLLCEEIIPALEAGAHGDRAGFVELVGTIETFREAAGTANRAEYTQADFLADWDLE